MITETGGTLCSVHLKISQQKHCALQGRRLISLIWMLKDKSIDEAAQVRTWIPHSTESWEMQGYSGS